MNIVNTLRDISKESCLNPTEKATLKTIAKECKFLQDENAELKKENKDLIAHINCLARKISP